MRKVSKRIYYTTFLFFVSCNLFAQVKIITRADSLFFIGINNEVIIQSEKIPVEKLSVSVNGGIISGKNGKYIVHCSSPNKDASVKIFYKKKWVAEKKMIVLRIADPVIYIAGDTLITGGDLISKKQLLSLDSLVVKTNVPFLSMTVIRFDFKRMSNNDVTDPLNNEGHIFSPVVKDVIKKTIKGDIIVFENVYSTGPGDGGTYRQVVKLTVAD
jgi:rhodanese-related sulfurtransferase